MPRNELDREISPYLLQHRDNPVHWMGWGEPAFARARTEDKPILLSVGYAACHWCHVMAHESFEDQATADLMNTNFVNIKVDREERPDVDRIYMNALHALGEQGGWPLTMFLTPAGEPFWGGTYFPPESRYGRPGFKHVLSEIARIWRSERHKAHANSATLTAALNQSEAPPQSVDMTPTQLQGAATAMLRAIDMDLGGLKGAPKFPQAPIFSFLWSVHERRPSEVIAAAVERTLTQICQGGIYDHLGGGMARYSVDPHWLVPHFEKMLYDNAQLVSLLTRCWLRNRHPLFRVRTEETIGFVLRDMTTADGAFAASYDADSEGEEGKFYVWTKEEIESLLDPPAAELFCSAYGVTTEGNWEGHTILNRSHALALRDEAIEQKLAAARQILFDKRLQRIHPGFDDKVLADWNGLMIAALAEAALVFGRDDWTEAAVRAMDRVMALLWRDAHLLHSYRAGQSRHEATAEGYANLITAARALHTLTGSHRYIATAEILVRALIAHFWDEKTQSLFFSSDWADGLISRTRSVHDDATPNANGIMLGNFAALFHLTGNRDYFERADAIAVTFSATALSNPFVAPSLMKNAGLLSDPVQLVLSGEGGSELLMEALPHTGLDIIFEKVASPADLAADHPAFAKAAAGGPARLYICRGQVCAAPAATREEVRAALELLGLAKA